MGIQFPSKRTVGAALRGRPLSDIQAVELGLCRARGDDFLSA